MSNLQFLMHKGELPILWKHKCDKKYSIQIPEQTFMCGLQTGGNNNDMPHWSITKKLVLKMSALQLKFIRK